MEVSGFWGSVSIDADFNSGVNIIIGKNGTGKTTFMNILQAILAVDPEALFDSPFDSVRLSLSNGARNRTVRVEKIEQSGAPFPYAKYQISNKSFLLPLYIADDSRAMPVMHRRRAIEEIQRIRAEMDELVSVASLSVHRNSYDTDPDSRERYPKKFVSPVDARLNHLINRLTQYHLEVSNEARKIAADLQRKVLISLLYTEADKKNLRAYPSSFDEKAERLGLTAAYKQLGISGPEISKKINEHVNTVARAVHKLSSAFAPKKGEKVDDFRIDISALEALKSTQDVVRMSLEAEVKSDELFAPTSLFTEILAKFIPEKKFEFSGGRFKVTSPDIQLFRLSSGEKQLLILLIETLLQKNEPCIFLADEPELSLHISWQRQIIDAVATLNPSAQIVVATHSPEVAGGHASSLVDMEDILHG